MERLREAIAIMACSKYGHPARVLLHNGKYLVSGDLHPGLGWTGMFFAVFKDLTGNERSCIGV